MDDQLIDGLDGDVTIERDQWGIPRVRASSVTDLFAGQGFATAVDRLGQMEWDRRRGLGRTAELHGTPSNVATDAVHRRLRLEDHARSGYDALDAETRAVLDAYVTGVNAAAQVAATPRELTAVGADPEPWEPWVPVLVFLVRHVNFATWQHKLWNTRVLAALGPEAIERFGAEGRRGTTPLIVPSGLTAALHELAAVALDADATDTILSELAALGLGESGSNAWAIHGSRTSSGSPIVAGDPHRALELPNVYIQIHLVGPGIDASGLSFVGVPGIQHFAQTDAVAWGVTNATADYQDLFVERLPDSITDRRVETILVRGGESVEVDCVLTAHGPIVVGPVGDDPAGDDAADKDAVGLALASTGLRAAGGSLRTILPFLRARSVDDFDTALAAWVEPANNFVFADRDGHIAYRAAGTIPRRHPLNQLLPVPGWDDTYAWRGTIDPAEMPAEHDSPDVVTANQRITGAPIGIELSPEYASPWRATRIRARLASLGDTPIAVDHQPGIHTDDMWLPGIGLARRLTAIADVPELAGWDGRLAADSEVAALVMRTYGHLVRRVTAALPAALLANPFAAWEPPATTIPPQMRVARALGPLLDAALAAPTEADGTIVDADELISGVRWVDHLADALAAARVEPPTTWGELHRLVPRYALRGADADLDAATTLVSPPVGGGYDCVLATTQLDGLSLATVIGPTARYVWDLSDRANSRWIVPLGASGDPASRHFTDQLAHWSSGELIPVVAAPVATVTLHAGGATAPSSSVR